MRRALALLLVMVAACSDDDDGVLPAGGLELEVVAEGYNGQRRETLLGKILRIDVDARNNGLEYAIPPDNPFVDDSTYRPEIFALGFRNPWRMSFDPQGRLVVADVGQEGWEEIDLVGAGDNLGWKIREGRHCFEQSSGCDTEGLVDPVFEYGREMGHSVTGGYVYLGERLPGLQGRYLFTDFVSGRVWALDLPASPEPVEAEELGRSGRSVATMGRDASGEIYLADFETGEILRLHGLR